MEPKFQSSFIPKGPLATTGTVTKTSRTSDRSILGMIAVFVFTISILASLGVFGYEWYLRRDIQKMGGELVAARTSLEPEVINKISSLDERIVSTKRLLDAHIVLSPLFDFLEGSTIRMVRFTSFNFATTDQGLELKMDGEARGYSALALQSAIFNSSPYMKDVVFGDLSLNNEGMVTFSMEAKLDPSIISFNQGAAEISPTQVETPSAVTPTQ